MDLKNLKIARIIMVAIIVVVSLFQGILGIRGLYKDIQKEFYNGTKDSIAIYTDIEDLMEYGVLIKKVLVTNGYLQNDSSFVKEIDLAYNQFESASLLKPDSMNEVIVSFTSMKTAVDKLIVEADKMDLDESTLKSYKQYKTEYEESLVFIKRSEFIETILEYNETIGQFPASLFRMISKVEFVDDQSLIAE